MQLKQHVLTIVPWNLADIINESEWDLVTHALNILEVIMMMMMTMMFVHASLSCNSLWLCLLLWLFADYKREKWKNIYALKKCVYSYTYIYKYKFYIIYIIYICAFMYTHTYHLPYTLVMMISFFHISSTYMTTALS